MRHLLFLFSMIFIFNGCFKKSGSLHEGVFEKRAVHSVDKSVEIPFGLAQIIEKYINSESTEAGGEAEPSRERLSLNKMRRFLPLKVFIKEIHKGVALKNNLLFDILRDGSIIDLKNHISQKRGSFYFGMQVSREFNSNVLNKLRVFYVSNAQSRKIQGRDFGVGCNKYIEMTKYFFDKLSLEGEEMNTTRQRYISLLSGTYFFVLPADQEYFVSTLVIKDSRFPELQCRS